MITSQRIHSIIRHPSILLYYFLWLISFGYRASVRVKCFSSSSYVEQWKSFSEFYSFRKGIPRFELHFFQNIEKTINPARTIFDVGANIGLFTLAFADIFRHAKVISFEPSHQTYNRLEINLNNSLFASQVHLENLALSNVNGHGVFLDDPKSPATNHLVESVTDSASLGNASYISVDCLKLDTYCQCNSITHIDLLKIDVEGYECQVLEGAHSLIENGAISWIFLELCPSNLASVGSSTDNLWKTISSLNLTPYQITSLGRLRPITYDNFCNLRLANIVVTSRSRDLAGLLTF